MTKSVQAMVGNIVVVSVLTRRALLPAMCDLKAAQINVRCCLNGYLILYVFKLSHNATKDEDAFDNSLVARWLKKFLKPCR